VNKLSQFWQELKLRNVVRRNTVYAATAFIILQLVDLVEKPLRLPEWTMPLVIVLLSIGFIISIIVSWIFEVNPEGSLVRTKPMDKGTKKKSASSSWKIASYISFIVIAAHLQ
jgi:hypothetical protein